jgi:uncharacterized protein (TIGR03437 family)
VYLPFLLILLVRLSAQECRITALTPAQPPNKLEEGERATESQTFQTNAFALGPGDVAHFFDSASRIRRIEASGRLTTLAGNGERGDTAIPGPARETALPNVTQILFDARGTLHFVGAGRVFRVVNGNIEAVAGSGRPGFNGESGNAVDMNLGGIVRAAFDYAGDLLIIDGFNRVRRVNGAGELRTVAGSTRVSVAAGRVGDDGPATAAALNSPRQVFPFRDGSYWIADLSGRHLRIVSADGIIRTVNANFEPTVVILPFVDGMPVAATANRVYPIRADGNIETGAAPYPAFTGTPLAIGRDSSLYFTGSARPEQRNPVLRLSNRQQTLVAGAPVAATVDGQAPPFGVWLPRTNSLLYSTTLGGKSGVLEARPGQQPRFVAGGGTDVGEADGKSATGISLFGVVAFTIDNDGRIIVGDLFRRRLLVIDASGTVKVLRDQAGDQIPYNPITSLSNLQRLATDRAGNIYWANSGATPTGGVFTAEVVVWNRANSGLTSYSVVGLAGIGRTENGDAFVLAGNSGTFRAAYLLQPTGRGALVPPYTNLPIASTTRWKDQPFFTTGTRLFRGEPGRLQMFDELTLPSGAAFAPDFVVAAPENLIVHSTDGGFYRIDNIEGCKWLAQPTISAVVNAASFSSNGTISPRQLITFFGTGLGPPEGQGFVLDGALRATAQPAPYPTLTLGNFSGAIANATVTGTNLPVIYSNDKQVTTQGPVTNPASNSYLLYFGWNGLTLLQPQAVRTVAAVPALFASEGNAAAIHEDGSRNSAANGAAAGSVVQFYGTGFGAIDTNIALGDFFSPTAEIRTTNAVSVTIGGAEAEVVFAGGAPGQIGGVYQLNVRIPAGLAGGAQKVSVSVAGQNSPDVNVFVR